MFVCLDNHTDPWHNYEAQRGGLSIRGPPLEYGGRAGVFLENVLCMGEIAEIHKWLQGIVEIEPILR